MVSNYTIVTTASLFSFPSADALINTGLAQLGYKYVNIGMDCSLDHISHDMLDTTTTVEYF